MKDEKERLVDTPFEPREDEIFGTWKDKDGKEHEFCVESTALAKLLVDEILLIGDFDSGPFFESGKASDENITTCLWVCANDIFAWACAESVPILTKEIPDLYRMHMADQKWGYIKWLCKKENMQPQKPIVRDMKREGAWCDLMKSLPKNPLDKVEKEGSKKCLADKAYDLLRKVSG